MNMSYCMFENTMNDLRHCVEAMDNADSMSELDLSRTEKAAYEYMRELCQNFLDCAERLEQEEADGQPDEAQEWADFDPEC
jgi:Ran GTPase-activating protein (RanGAP) involved in mRNA processing and transport